MRIVFLSYYVLGGLLWEVAHRFKNTFKKVSYIFNSCVGVSVRGIIKLEAPPPTNLPILHARNETWMNLVWLLTFLYRFLIINRNNFLASYQRTLVLTFSRFYSFTRFRLDIWREIVLNTEVFVCCIFATFVYVWFVCFSLQLCHCFEYCLRE